MEPTRHLKSLSISSEPVKEGRKPDQADPFATIKRLERKLAREQRAREEAERLLEEKSEELFRASAKSQMLVRAMDNAGDGILVTDENGVFVYVNSSQAEMFGYQSDELIGQKWDVLFSREEKTRLLAASIPRLDVVGKWQGETTGLNKSGQGVLQEISMARLDAGGIIAATRDISRRRHRELMLKEMEMRLQDAERNAALAMFGQSMAHDLNNLMAVISGYTALLMQETGEGSHKVQIERILKASQQAKDVIHAIEAQTAETDTQVKDVNLSILMRQSLEIAEGLCPPSIKLRHDLEEDVVISTDELLMSRSLLNIIKNSVEAFSRDEKGQVRVKLARDVTGPLKGYENYIELGHEADEYCAVIDIVDTGCGMTRPDLANVFTPFHTSKIDMDKGQGQGLGMQSIKALVDSDLAYVRIGSSLGKGTCFRLCLRAPKIETLTTQDARITTRDPHIMIVDDDQDVGQMMSAMLAEYEWR